MNKKAIIAVIVAAIVVPAAVYAVGPYFTNTTIDEPLPTSALSMKKDEATGVVVEKTEDPAITEKVVQEIIEEDKTAEASSISVQDEIVVQQKETELNSQNTVTQSTSDDKVVPLSGTFIGVGDGIHDAQGNALVIPIEADQSVLRLEEFRSTNGPDLYVYLATDKGASEFVNLGRLKANIGNQNYEIPQGTDLTKYDTVLIWCKQFSVLFGSAQLS